MTPQPARETAAQVTFMKFGTPTPVCKECSQTPVNKTGDVCSLCVRVIATRDELKHDQELGRLILKYVAFLAILGLLAVVVVTALQQQK